MRLLVPIDEAERLIANIPNRTCAQASAEHWQVSPNGDVKARSALWLFCWAKTGRGSDKAARAARIVFDTIFPVTFAEFDARVDHQYARKNRYSECDLEAELAARISGLPS